MISILIPVYNFDIVDLVKTLHLQACTANIPFEIICIDDGSTEKYQNESLRAISKVRYSELSKNVGRSRIRNLLAHQATYNQLLFLDCDSSILQENFIQQYIDHANENAIVYGGRNYEKNAPQNKDYYLRWYYGVKRETTSASVRKEHPYRSFMTNNFLIPKDIYLKHPLDENIKGYGHEDTLLGIDLKKAEIPIIHIDNPLCHIGLETAEEFLEKSICGIQNLSRLIQNGKIANDVKLYKYYLVLKKARLTSFFQLLIRPYIKGIEKQLLSAKPRLKLFDIWKLYQLSKTIS